MNCLLGCDIGTSSVKVSLVSADDGRLLGEAFAPKREAPVLSPRPGFAEQDPRSWYAYFKEALDEALARAGLGAGDVAAIGLSYQMHGLVLLDEAGEVLRPAIIWCDSRAVDCGQRLERRLGSDYCLGHLLNAPGNFTAAKLFWVAEHEPEIFARARRAMLPGDYLAFRLSGRATTTPGGLSEGACWDFAEDRPASEVLEALGASAGLLPETVPSLGLQAAVSAAAAAELGLRPGTPVTYRAGDQPNNAFSLNVLEPGEVAATAGTSGVVYAVSDRALGDRRGRFNLFAHVNHSLKAPRLGALMCLNGAGSQLSFARRSLCPELGYAELNALAASAPPGCDGLLALPFGNGAERVLENRCPGARLANLDFNRHGRAHLLRAVQEGVACAFRLGLDCLKESGHGIRRIRAGQANMFLSPLFAQAVADLGNCPVELYATDGAAGAARGAGLGLGLFKSPGEALRHVTLEKTYEPRSAAAAEEYYGAWLQELQRTLN